jgi:hypothetical protein
MKVIVIRFTGHEVSWESLHHFINGFAGYNAQTALTYFMSYKTNENRLHFLINLIDLQVHVLYVDLSFFIGHQKGRRELNLS